ncbi:fatty acyl-AMP ligase [Mycobacterium sp. SVM_VP21]|nr:fatty acyl-AMP ligase [Mycobacterium sp. SVM_VP21]
MTPTPDTLLDLLLQQADRRADQVAFRYCPEGDAEQGRLTYRELDTRARAIAAGLQRHGAAGQRVLLFSHPGLDSVAGFFGCFYAGAVAVPVDEQWPTKRAAAVIPDARAQFALSTADRQAKLRAKVETLSQGPLHWATLDEPEADPDSWILPPIDSHIPAVLQYTSGSTGSPKGVVLNHSNYLHNLAGMCAAWRLGFDGSPIDDPTIGVSWLPNFHDLGFVGGVLAPLYIGGTMVLLSRSSFFMRPIRWMQAMSKYRAEISAAPNLGYHLCVKRTSEAERAGLDLSHWKVAVNGGDPVDAATLDSFAETFAPAGFAPEAFLPAYGLAEATLAVTGGSASPMPVIRHIDRRALGEDRAVDAVAENPEAAPVVGCGRPGGGQEVVVVDPDTRRRCSDDEVGEIWVAGPSVAQGYWRKPADTARTFSAFLADTGQGPFLRTGDRGFLHDGELFIVGRCQDLITIDGTHYYPNDIEMTVQACDPVLLAGRGAVFAVEPRWNAVEQLTVVQEVHRHHTVELGEVIEKIRAAIDTHHKIQAHTVLLVKPMSIPTTTSGKIQRNACREKLLARELTAVAEWRADPPGSRGVDMQQVKAGLARAIGGMLVRRYWEPPETGV